MSEALVEREDGRDRWVRRRGWRRHRRERRARRSWRRWQARRLRRGARGHLQTVQVPLDVAVAEASVDTVPRVAAGHRGRGRGDDDRVATVQPDAGGLARRSCAPLPLPKQLVASVRTHQVSRLGVGDGSRAGGAGDGDGAGGEIAGDGIDGGGRARAAGEGAGRGGVSGGGCCGRGRDDGVAGLAPRMRWPAPHQMPMDPPITSSTPSVKPTLARGIRDEQDTACTSASSSLSSSEGSELHLDNFCAHQDRLLGRAVLCKRHLDSFCAHQGRWLGV
eukprot:5953262-Prymnesium_polylepis.1